MAARVLRKQPPIRAPHARGGSALFTDLLRDRLPGVSTPQLRHRLANLAPAGKIPRVGKPRALLGFDGLDPAIPALQKDALLVRFVDKGQPVPLRPEPRVLLDEVVFAHPEKRGNARHLRLGDFHKARPPATRRATLALVMNRGFHGKTRFKAGKKVPSLPVDVKTTGAYPLPFPSATQSAVDAPGHSSDKLAHGARRALRFPCLFLRLHP